MWRGCASGLAGEVECWVFTHSLRGTWTSTTQSTYSEIFFDYTIGKRISHTHVQIVDHNCVKSRNFEVCFIECWVPTHSLRETWTLTTQSTYFEICFDYTIGKRISHTNVQIVDHNCVKSRKFEVCFIECRVSTHSLRETWTSTTQSTYSEIFFDYTIGKRISHTHVQIVDHNCVKSRNFEVCFIECWVPTHSLRETWTLTTQSTYFEICFDYTIGKRIEFPHIVYGTHELQRLIQHIIKWFLNT